MSGGVRVAHCASRLECAGLCQITTRANYKDNPCKTVYHVADAAATLAKLVELGGTMVRPASPMPAFNNKITAIAKDFDGYVIEVVQD